MAASSRRTISQRMKGLPQNAPVEAIKVAEREAWLAENERAFEAANAHMAKHGLFSDAYRKF